MDSMMAQMLSQLGKEQKAEDNGQVPPDMPDMSKLINQVTQSLFSNPQMQNLLKSGGSQGNSISHVQSNKPKLLVHKLIVTLAELYNGCERSVKMRRQVYNAETGKNVWEKTVISVSVVRGMRYGEHILVPGVGDVLKDKEPGDLEIVLNPAKETGIFMLEGEDDLKMHIDITLSEMFSYSAAIEHLDGETYSVQHRNATDALNGTFKVVDLGLPRSDGTFGDLLVVVSVQIPENEAALREEIRIIEMQQPVEEDADAYRLERVVG